jgi:hypothetical protein
MLLLGVAFSMISNILNGTFFYCCYFSCNTYFNYRVHYVNDKDFSQFKEQIKKSKCRHFVSFW